jgi:hypothetical protein
MRTENKIANQKDEIPVFQSIKEMFNDDFEEPLEQESRDTFQGENIFLNSDGSQFLVEDWHPSQSADSDDNPLEIPGLFSGDGRSEQTQIENSKPKVIHITNPHHSIHNETKDDGDKFFDGDSPDLETENEESLLRESLYGKPSQPPIPLESRQGGLENESFLEASEIGKPGITDSDPRTQRIWEGVVDLIKRINELETSEERLEWDLARVTDEAQRARENNRHVLEQINQIELQNDKLIADLRIREATIAEQTRMLEQKGSEIENQASLLTQFRARVTQLETALGFYMRARLIRTVNEIAKICNRQNWSPGFEYQLWEVIQSGGGEIGYSRLTSEEVSQLQEFSKEATGWVAWDPKNGLTFITMNNWLTNFTKWKSENTSVKLPPAAQTLVPGPS